MTEHTCAQTKILLTKAEAAAAISYSLRSLDYAISAGALPIVRHGGRVFISRRALEAFAEKDRDSMVPKGGQLAPERHQP